MGMLHSLLPAASAQSPQDAVDSEFINIGSIPETDPAHPRNGAIPAFHVYRSLRQHLVDAAAGSTIADEVMANWPSSIRYFPIWFTRTWQRVPDCSIYFSSQAVPSH